MVFAAAYHSVWLMTLSRLDELFTFLYLCTTFDRFRLRQFRQHVRFSLARVNANLLPRVYITGRWYSLLGIHATDLLPSSCRREGLP